MIFGGINATRSLLLEETALRKGIFQEITLLVIVPQRWLWRGTCLSAQGVTQPYFSDEVPRRRFCSHSVPYSRIFYLLRGRFRSEVSVTQFVERHTGIRVPYVPHYGMTDESPTRLGLFIIMESLERDSNLTRAFKIPVVQRRTYQSSTPESPKLGSGRCTIIWPIFYCS